MKKILLLALVLLSTAIHIDAQSKVYCEIVSESVGIFNSKISVIVDFGQSRKFFSSNKLVDENGKALVFNSIIDAMNYMSSQGWNFEQAYVTVSSSKQGTDSECYLILSKFTDKPADCSDNEQERP